MSTAASIRGSIGRWWFASAPAERLAAVRILVGSFALLWVAARLAEFHAVALLPAQHWRPTGVTRLLDAPLPPGLALGVAIATSLLLVAFVVGWRYRITAPLAALGLLWTLTYRNSWGMIFHTENLLVLHVITLACGSAADAWSLDRWREQRAGVAPRSAPDAGYGWVLKLMLAITAVTYVLAGIAKLRLAGMAWLDGEQLRNQIAVDNLRKALLGDMIAPLGTLFLDHPSGFTVFSVLTIVFELSAPLVLVGPRLGRWWSLAAWGFHLGVVLLMNIWFLYPLVGLAYVAVLRAERPFAWLIRWWRRRRGIPGA